MELQVTFLLLIAAPMVLSIPANLPQQWNGLSAAVTAQDVFLGNLQKSCDVILDNQHDVTDKVNQMQSMLSFPKNFKLVLEAAFRNFMGTLENIDTEQSDIGQATKKTLQVVKTIMVELVKLEKGREDSVDRLKTVFDVLGQFSDNQNDNFKVLNRVDGNVDDANDKLNELRRNLEALIESEAKEDEELAAILISLEQANRTVEDIINDLQRIESNFRQQDKMITMIENTSQNHIDRLADFVQLLSRMISMVNQATELEIQFHANVTDLVQGNYAEIVNRLMNIDLSFFSQAIEGYFSDTEMIWSDLQKVRMSIEDLEAFINSIEGSNVFDIFNQFLAEVLSSQQNVSGNIDEAVDNHKNINSLVTETETFVKSAFLQVFTNFNSLISQVDNLEENAVIEENINELETSTQAIIDQIESLKLQIEDAIGAIDVGQNNIQFEVEKAFEDIESKLEDILKEQTNIELGITSLETEVFNGVKNAVGSLGEIIAKIQRSKAVVITRVDAVARGHDKIMSHITELQVSLSARLNAVLGIHGDVSNQLAKDLNRVLAMLRMAMAREESMKILLQTVQQDTVAKLQLVLNGHVDIKADLDAVSRSMVNQIIAIKDSQQSASDEGNRLTKTLSQYNQEIIAIDKNIDSDFDSTFQPCMDDLQDIKALHQSSENAAVDNVKNFRQATDLLRDHDSNLGSSQGSLEASVSTMMATLSSAMDAVDAMDALMDSFGQKLSSLEGCYAPVCQ